jgi:carbon-monoxide dehydrogenase small subunit
VRVEPVSESAIRTAISGNLCRCTGYVDIIRSISLAASTVRETRQGRASEA